MDYNIEFDEYFRKALTTPASALEEMQKLYDENGQEGSIFIKPSWKDVIIPNFISKLELCLDFTGACISPLIVERRIDAQLNLPPKNMEEIYDIHVKLFALVKDEFNDSEVKISNVIILEKVADSNVAELVLVDAYLSRKDWELLALSKKITRLELRAFYGEEISLLSSSLKTIKIVLYTKGLSHINFKEINLEHLIIVSSPNIIFSDIVVQLPKLKQLLLPYNNIDTIRLEDLPNSLKVLDLSNNKIENSLFDNQNKYGTIENVKYLSLRNNKFKFSTSLLSSIIRTFPNLSTLYLLGNEIINIPQYIIGDRENQNCIESIKNYLNKEQFKNKPYVEELKSTFRLYDNNLEIRWEQDDLPARVIISEIQDYFEKVPKDDTKLIICRNGLYLNYLNKETSLIIKRDIKENNSITLNLNSNNVLLLPYFFKFYFEIINNLVSKHFHYFFVPVLISNIENDEFSAFFEDKFNLNALVKSERILLYPKSFGRSSFKALVNNPKVLKIKSNDNIKVEYQRKGVIDKLEYEDIENIAFIIVRGYNAFPFILKEGKSLSNILIQKNSRNFDGSYNVTLGKPKYKDNYIDSLTNKYLRKRRFKKGKISILDFKFIPRDVTVLFNPSYFAFQNEKFICKDPKVKLDEKKINNVHHKGNTYFKISFDNNIITGVDIRV